MYHHVTAYLSDVQSVIPYLYQTHHLIGDDVEDEDVKRVVAGIDEEPFEPALAGINPSADVIGHQESEDGGDGERQELLEGGSPVHVGSQVFREEPDDEAKEQGGRNGEIMTRHQLVIIIDKLTEDKADAEEKTAHHIAIATLYEIDDFQTFPGLPAAEQQHNQTDKEGCHSR